MKMKYVKFVHKSEGVSLLSEAYYQYGSSQHFCLKFSYSYANILKSPFSKIKKMQIFNDDSR